MKILQLSIPPLPRYAATARAALSKFALDHRLAASDVENLIFALGEALANAIQHAETHDNIDISAEVHIRSIVVTVSDRGRGIAKPPRGAVSFPGVFAEAGRGFAIMERCTDFLDVRSDPGQGTVVTLGQRRRNCQELNTAS